MQNQARWHFTVLAALTLASSGCAAMSWPSAGPGVAAADPIKNRESWWKSNKHSAVFVPGKGYQVAGYEGFYDDDGRPMQSAGEQVAYNFSTIEEDAPKRDFLDQLNPTVVRENLKKPFAPKRDTDLASQRFAEGEALFQKREFAAAAKKFSDATKLTTRATQEEDALFMLGESYFFSDRYPKANDAYDELIKKYPSSRHLDRVVTRQFAIARYWQEHHQKYPHWPTTPNLFDKKRHWFDTRGHAMRTFENIRIHDPTGPLADDALMAAGNSHFLAGRWDDADYAYEVLRREYPQSEHQYQAHLLGLQCKLRKYQGPDYDGKPIDEAMNLVEQLFKQFPDKITDERERLERLRGEVLAQRAYRDYRLAEYYDRKSEYRAAKFYYAEVVKHHPQTSMAEAAQKRIAELQGRPDVPTEPIDWLVNLVPGMKKTDLASQSSEAARR